MAGARQPTELLLVKGKKHLTKNEIKNRIESEVKANFDNIAAPAYLSKSQKTKFNELSKELTDINIMSNLDCDLLARFIIANDLYIKCTKTLNKKEIQEDVFKFEKISNLQDKYFKQCLSCSKELGLTISSRCKLVVPKKPDEKPKSEMSKFMQNRNSVVNINHAVGDE